MTMEPDKELDELIGRYSQLEGIVRERLHKILQDSEIDELVSTVGFYFLFRAKLISGDYSRDRIRAFMALTSDNDSVIERKTDRILKDREMG